jgi:hypothetical protein
MPQIMTASWFAKLPPGAAPVGISRGVPRSKAGYQRLHELEPGPWFRSVSPEQYLTRYRQILDRLDPGVIRDQLLDYGDVPVMLCWEAARDCHAGSKWCHRHLVAQWLEDRLGIEVPEVGFPTLDRFAFLKKFGVQVPSYLVQSHPAARKQRLR